MCKIYLEAYEDVLTMLVAMVSVTVCCPSFLVMVIVCEPPGPFVTCKSIPELAIYIETMGNLLTYS